MQYHGYLGLHFCFTFFHASLLQDDEKNKNVSVYLYLLHTVSHYANHIINRAQVNEIGVSPFPSWKPFPQYIEDKCIKMKKIPPNSQILTLKFNSFIYAGVEVDVGNPFLVFGDEKQIGTHMGLVQSSWKLGSPWYGNHYSKLFPNPPFPSSYLQWAPPIDASGECWNGFAMG